MPEKIEIGDHNREILERIRARYPARQSAWGALLDEIMRETDSPDRWNAAIIFALEGYRRGLKRLEKLVDRLVSADVTSEDSCIAWRERNLLCQILFAVGRMDTVASHALLARLLREAPSPIVRALTLDGMAFEGERFDWDLVAPFASIDCHRSEILSALYALEFRAQERPKEARERVVPLLTYPHPMVRNYAIRLLSYRPENLDLLLPFRDDPEPLVREGVEEAIRMADRMLEDE